MKVTIKKAADYLHKPFEYLNYKYLSVATLIFLIPGIAEADEYMETIKTGVGKIEFIMYIFCGLFALVAVITGALALHNKDAEKLKYAFIGAVALALGFYIVGAVFSGVDMGDAIVKPSIS